MSGKLSLIPAPSRLVIRPFDTLTPELQKLGIVLPDNAVHGRNTTGLIVTTHRGPQSVEVDAAGDTQGFDYWLNVGDQVIFPAMSGNEITLPEPTEDRPRNQQRYIMIQERDVIAKITSDKPVEDVAVEPRSYVAN